ncbi:MAG: cation-translocating P-type ATPase [Pirellulaceae bacterium]|nr:cation-translocating P-type ATPase [Thermoguttaceae bacterium]MDI9446240.1 cation-translocating P-type ATPase [Planctomycetota bacterium]NLZ01177.1 cation-translocating P-type ATPase [Pirellulaceae bacterium]
MSQFASPASAHLQRSLEVPLTTWEQGKIAVQLGSAMLAGGLLAVGIVQQRFGPPELSEVADLIIALAACVVALPIFVAATRGVATMDPNSFGDQLVALATLAAMAMGDFVTATLIPVIMSLGHFFEERSVLGAQAAIEGLRKLHARKATLLTSAGERQVEPQTLRNGDMLVVRPGELIAADGEIVEGDSSVDQSSITGESVPVDLGPTATAYAGSVNLSGVLKVRVTRTGSQTTLGRVVELLRGAEQSKTPVLKLIEQYAGYYLPIILTISGVVLFITRDMSRAVAVLVVGCPGALVLSGPTAMVAALAAASRLGILIKNTRFLESLSDADTVVLDKTGTVTLGRLEVVAVEPLAERGEQDVLRAGLVCAHASRHPASRAIVQAAGRASLQSGAYPLRAEEIGGQGIVAVADSSRWLLGRRTWLVAEGIAVPEGPKHNGPVVWLGRIDCSGQGPGEALGCFLLADRVRPEAKDAIAQLRALGLARTVLLTGDRKDVAEQIGRDLAVDQIVAEVLPEEKLELVRAERNAGHLVMVVGDGVNDALALARSDVGIALGAAASDVALRSADVAIMADDMGRLPIAVRLARRTRTTIHQNVSLGAGTSLLFIWLASAGIVAPLTGALLHNIGAALVLLNSARLLGFAAAPNKPRGAG